MAALNTAYERGDADAMRRILAEEAGRPEEVEGDGVGARLVRVLRRVAQARSRLAELEQLPADLATDPMHTLYAQVREEWLAGSDPLAEDEAQLKTRIDRLRVRLAAFGPSGEVVS